MTAPDPLDLRAAIAATRFGLGARPGEIAAARPDPQGFLLAQIRRDGADQPPGDLPSATQSFGVYRAEQIRRGAMKVEAAAAETRAPARQPMTDAAAPAVGDGAMAAGGDAAGLKEERRALLEPLREQALAEIYARTVLGASTPAGFRERWTLFWANHFTVSAKKPQAAALAGPFEREAIRPRVFQRFSDLLIASTTHPGMIVYLDQARSIGPDSRGGLRARAGLNENLGREILELHTVGADAGYTQADVTEFARALTGYSLARGDEGGAEEGAFLWRANIHEPGPRTVMGRRYTDEDGTQALRILVDLARHPKTSARIARKLAAHFVADDPPQSLVERLDAAYMRTGGDLAVLAETLIRSPEAWGPAQGKFKTPNDFVLSSWRAAGAAPATPQEAAQPLQLLGQRPFAAPQPNGWGEAAAEWADGGAIMRRLGWASSFAGRHAPQTPPLETADGVLGAVASPGLRAALARAETRQSAFALLLMSPEFQRR